MTKKCYYCSYPNKDDALRCVNCGIELKKYWKSSGFNVELIDEKKK